MPLSLIVIELFSMSAFEDPCITIAVLHFSNTLSETTKLLDSPMLMPVLIKSDGLSRGFPLNVFSLTMQFDISSSCKQVLITTNELLNSSTFLTFRRFIPIPRSNNQGGSSSHHSVRPLNTQFWISTYTLVLII